MEQKIKRILKRDFPTCSVDHINIITRKGDTNTMNVRIDGEIFYLSYLPQQSRLNIYDLIN